MSPNKTIGMNEHAWQAFGAPAAVEMLYDGNRNMIGLRPCDPQKRNAFEVRTRLKGKHYSISAGTFLNHFDIKPTRTMLFEKIDIENDGTLTLDLTRTIVVTRGSR
jgi:hypothetical protein